MTTWEEFEAGFREEMKNITPENIVEILLHVGSEKRAALFHEIYYDYGLQSGEAFEIALLDAWCSTPAPRKHFGLWLDVLPHPTITDDQAAFDALPDKVTIYRGSGSKESARAGFSWTLDRELALKFAHNTTNFISGTVMVPRDEAGFIATATIPKRQMSLYITARKESEVVLHFDYWPDDETVERVES